MTEASTSRPAGERVEVGGEVAYIAIAPFGGPRARFQAPTAIAVDQSAGGVRSSWLPKIIIRAPHLELGGRWPRFGWRRGAMPHKLASRDPPSSTDVRVILAIKPWAAGPSWSPLSQYAPLPKYLG